MAPRAVNAGATAQEVEAPMQGAGYTEQDMARFWAKVDKTSERGCWLWTASIRPDGYGQLWHRPSQRPIVAHRWAYMAFVGPIPDGLELDHLCRTRHCVNPAHLEPVTTAENLTRGLGFSGQNARKTHCANGHPLSGDNLAIRQGRRGCVTCRRAKSRRRYAKHRDEITQWQRAYRAQQRNAQRTEKGGMTLDELAVLDAVNIATTRHQQAGVYQATASQIGDVLRTDDRMRESYGDRCDKSTLAVASHLAHLTGRNGYPRLLGPLVKQLGTRNTRRWALTDMGARVLGA